jgi:hypothetical protein
VRYNLKTFPKMVVDPTTNEQEVIAWKNGFEKELRVKLAYALKCYDAWMGKRKHRKDAEIAIEWKLLANQLKEILGEKE